MINPKELLQYTKDLTLLFVEDYPQLRANTSEILKNFFKEVESASNGIEALELYKNKPYDIVITDIQMPKMNGVVLTERLYEINPEQIVVVLSAHDESPYLLPLINLGIEQFVKKPIDYQELLKVLLTIAKKSNLPTKDVIASNKINLNKNLSFNRETKILQDSQGSVYLTKNEILFLELLIKQIGKIYSNDEIVSYFTSLNETIDSRNIRKLVSKLRKKLPADSLESIYGVGYRISPFIP